VSEQILYILATILTTILSYVAVKIKSAIERRINAQIKQDAVYVCVRCVEQWDLQGRVKKLKKHHTAENMILEWIDSEGVSINRTELQALIESAVYELNRDKNTGASEHFLN